MKITELKSEGLNKSYKVVVPADDFTKEVDNKLAHIAKTAKIQGFRAGKAPLSMIKKKYFNEVMAEALDDMVRSSTSQVLSDKKLRPVNQPSVKINSFGEGKDLEFEMDVEILPDIKIGDFSKISLDKFTAEVPAEEVDKAVKYLAETRKESVKVDGKKAAKGECTHTSVMRHFDMKKATYYKLAKELGLNTNKRAITSK